MRVFSISGCLDYQLIHPSGTKKRTRSMSTTSDRRPDSVQPTEDSPNPTQKPSAPANKRNKRGGRKSVLHDTTPGADGLVLSGRKKLYAHVIIQVLLPRNRETTVEIKVLMLPNEIRMLHAGPKSMTMTAQDVAKPMESMARVQILPLRPTETRTHTPSHNKHSIIPGTCQIISHTWLINCLLISRDHLKCVRAEERVLKSEVSKSSGRVRG